MEVDEVMTVVDRDTGTLGERSCWRVVGEDGACGEYRVQVAKTLIREMVWRKKFDDIALIDVLDVIESLKFLKFFVVNEIWDSGHTVMQ